ncbi:TPM domain-containing protein [Aetokthonos hydrillicola Thurmond2011]|jgi:energy-converting hydrogenase Eha subunit A|uniref:TPM domain-containing protein n=1 Tax=Aetokthonos hydrillicola Thurmond2011 TaxID=2712845 RepID=A0AAP5M8L7_9CYAN|nr:TPM domain-containing protein [Aetokthonos hydrillicola]MBW4588074.1 TPM domain-containing protein [Aetokthonos hydrillicola CCALA 1050]MDR9893389.1 TPM domain-containing protein [Aetokthonos hydrillicola Thurmond2011]
MQHRFWRRILAFVAVIFLAGSIWVINPPSSYAYDNPELLPATPTPVVDLAKSLTSVQEENLVKDLEQFESQTGWKLRVLTQYDRTPGRAVINFWGLDDKSVLLVADSRGGNILSFSVGDAVYNLLPRTFWIELQTRFGNLYYVREQGEDQAILEAMQTVKNCLLQGGCRVVPGLPREQWILTLITSVVGGVICGFAAQPRKEGQIFAWQWALIFSPLWGILFIAFGIGPVVSRTSDFLPLFRNVVGFVLGALVAYLSPTFSRSSPSEM